MALRIGKNTRRVIVTSVSGKKETLFFNRDYIENEFQGNETLKGIEICDGVTQIRDDAFKGCTSLTTVILPSSLSRIGFDAFVGCSALQEIIVQGILDEVDCCFDAKGVSKMTLNKPSSKELIDNLLKGYAMDISISKVEMSFPIVGWKSQNRVLWDAFNAGKDFFGDEAFCKEKDYICRMQHNNIVGIDVPVKLNNGKGKKGTIMIIAESPARDTRNMKGNGTYIGTPFAVAHKFNIPSQCKIYKHIFCKLLDAGYDVYITDAVKEWNKGLKKKEFVNHIDYPVLKTEIRNVKPVLIVTWGDIAKIACYNIFNDRKSYYPQTHPVNHNWDRWKVKMLKETIVNGSELGKNYVNDPLEDRVKDPIYLADYISQEILRKAKNPPKYQLPSVVLHKL